MTQSVSQSHSQSVTQSVSQSHSQSVTQSVKVCGRYNHLERDTEEESRTDNGPASTTQLPETHSHPDSHTATQYLSHTATQSIVISQTPTKHIWNLSSQGGWVRGMVEERGWGGRGGGGGVGGRGGGRGREGGGGGGGCGVGG